MLNDFQKEVKNNKGIGETNSKSIGPKIEPFKHGTTGEYNTNPRLSKAGRLVCGRVL